MSKYKKESHFDAISSEGEHSHISALSIEHNRAQKLNLKYSHSK